MCHVHVSPPPTYGVVWCASHKSKHTSAQDPRQWYHRRLSVWKESCRGMQDLVTGPWIIEAVCIGTFREHSAQRRRALSLVGFKGMAHTSARKDAPLRLCSGYSSRQASGTYAQQTNNDGENSVRLPPPPPVIWCTNPHTVIYGPGSEHRDSKVHNAGSCMRHTPGSIAPPFPPHTRCLVGLRNLFNASPASRIQGGGGPGGPRPCARPPLRSTMHPITGGGANTHYRFRSSSLHWPTPPPTRHPPAEGYTRSRGGDYQRS